jgi:hypothetical protein
MEMRAALRVIGKHKADDLADALAIWKAYIYQLAGFDSDAFESEQVIAGNMLHIKVTKCAVLEGAKRAKLERSNHACMACAVAWGAWFRTLLPDNEVIDEIISQMGFGAQKCQFRINVLEIDRK